MRRLVALWFALVLLAMAAYALLQLWQAPDLDSFFARRQPCSNKP